MSTERTMTLLEAAEWFYFRCVGYTQGFKADDLATCVTCGNRAGSPATIAHTKDCPYAAAVQAIRQARAERECN